MPTTNKIIYKILFILTAIILIFSSITLLYIYKNNAYISNQLIDKQKSYISQHFIKEETRLQERELEYIEEHALYIVNSVKNALLNNSNKEIIKEVVKVFMKQKSIQSIYIFDDITEESYLTLTKKENTITEEKIATPNTFKLLKYSLDVDGNNFGYIEIYYDIVPLLDKIHRESQKAQDADYRLIKKQAKVLKKETYSYIINNIIIFIFFTLTILISIVLVFTKYVNNPLHIVQNNLYQFFQFFKEAKSNLKLKNIDSNDEFGDISKEINANIQTVLDIHNEIEETQKEILITMGTIAEAHSEETSNHIKRVAKYSVLLGKYYGLNDDEIKVLKDASTMHDIGKIAIPDNILNKPGKLESDEFEIMKEHTVHGYNMFKHSNKTLLNAAATIAYEHHEKYDGTGYPRGLKGEEIHIYGRILALVDVFDALGSDRVYKKAWEDEKIFTLIKKEKGKHFDPKLVDIFFTHLDKFKEIRELYKDTFDIFHPKEY